jgi:hypothetical protein
MGRSLSTSGGRCGIRSPGFAHGPPPIKGEKPMLAANYPPIWNLWRANRTRELLAEGMAQDTAFRFADLEMTGRVRLAKVIGFEAASKAELGVTQDSNGKDRWYIIVDPDLVPPEMREAAEQFHFGKKTPN